MKGRSGVNMVEALCQSWMIDDTVLCAQKNKTEETDNHFPPFVKFSISRQGLKLTKNKQAHSEAIRRFDKDTFTYQIHNDMAYFLLSVWVHYLM